MEKFDTEATENLSKKKQEGQHKQKHNNSKTNRLLTNVGWGIIILIVFLAGYI